MREFPFDDIDDGKMRIKIDDRDTNTFIEKTLEPADWKEVLMEVVFMLNGCGYVIDPRKAEKAFNELSASQLEEYLKDE
jgi:hypothetical protein